MSRPGPPSAGVWAGSRWIGRARRFASFGVVDVGRACSYSLVEAMHVVRIVDAERRLDDGKLHNELDARGAAPAEIRSWRNRQLPGKTRAQRRRERGIRQGLPANRLRRID